MRSGSFRVALLGVSMSIATMVAVGVASCSIAVNKVATADDEIIRTIGVPTDYDDTLGTSSKVHRAPRNVASPDCFPIGAALCMADTARIDEPGSGADGDGGVSTRWLTRWLVFAASGDSIQAFMAPSAGSYLSMSPASAAGYFKENAAAVDASFLRARFAATGTYVFTASMSAESPAPYDLRVLPVVSRAATRPNGGVASLVIVGDSAGRYAVVPRSVAAMTRVLADSGGTHAAVRAGTYRVLLVRDSVYLACRVPCGTPATFALRPGGTTTIAPR
jgi:hypothetical protein